MQYRTIWVRTTDGRLTRVRQAVGTDWARIALVAATAVGLATGILGVVVPLLWTLG